MTASGTGQALLPAGQPAVLSHRILRKAREAPTESTVSRKEAAECKTQGGSRHVELAREVVWKRERSKMPLEIIPGITEGRVCQDPAKPVCCSLGSDHTGLYQ